MELTFKFFDEIHWSVYGTICVLIPLVLLIIARQPLNSTNLIFISLIGMMKGNIVSRIIFTGFLNLLVYKATTNWMIQSIIYIISTIITYYIPYDISNLVLKDNLRIFIFKITVFIWIFYILYLIWKKK